VADDDEAVDVRPPTPARVSRHLEAGERIVRTEALHGRITAEMRRLTIGKRDGGTRDLVLRTFADVEHAGHRSPPGELRRPLHQVVSPDAVRSRGSP